MIKFRHDIKGHFSRVLALLALCFVPTLTPTTVFATGFEIYKGCFIDLKGWERGEIDGMTMAYSGVSMVTASTRYSAKDKEIEVTFVGGGMPGLQPLDLQGTFEMETSEVSVRMKTIEGKTVTITFNKTDNTSTLYIILTKPQGENGKGAMLTFVGTNMDTKELLDIARRFPWKCFEKGGDGKQ